MAFLNLNKITGDPNVDEVNQINLNWDEIDNKVGPYIVGGFLPNVETGQEYPSGGRYNVWNGSAGRTPDDTIQTGWGAWVNLPVVSPRAIRPGFQPKWRNNSYLRKIECAGGYQFDSAANPWTLGSYFAMNFSTTGSPGISFAPVGGIHVQPIAAALSAGTTVVASAMAKVDVSTDFVRISVQYMGGPGGGNFIMLDQLSWWY
ncbi:hypothetical protein [Streptomyces griseosporeus]|uniref:hypothetical protein n=1 Tax=Streptomyces griseosporeus TaxID=1910 RepID=UPI00167D359E|nr:hypothetical protein [Streptomyces griseosporeus]GHF92032.1 hypothetical protein GCM10018783_73570 [Streptomyces griseosporeus]